MHGLPGAADVARPYVIDKDVTGRESAERALLASEERFRALIENGAEFVAILDADGTFAFASASYGRLLGHDPKTLVGSYALQLMHPDDYAWSVEAFGRILARAGEVVTTFARVRHADGSYRTVEFTVHNLLAHPAVAGIVCNGRDVTDRQAAEAELRFRAQLLDTVEQAVVATTLDGTITYWNRFAERLYGWSREEALGRKVVEITPVDVTREQVEEIMRRIGQGESWSGELEVQARDGRRFPAHMTDSPIHDANGKLVGIVGISMDISEQRRLEERLRQSQKLEAVGQLAGGVAHDFNNLLTVLGANVHFLRELLPPGAHGNAEVEEIAAAVTRAAALTRQLLAFSRKQMLMPQPLDLNSVVSILTRMLQRLIGEDIVLETELAPDVGTVLADRGQLEQVLMNLAVNARDAMPGGGRLSLRTARLEVDGAMALRSGEVTPGSYASLTVADTGHGMDRATLAHVFEPFFTTKGVGRGTGLGLATVYGIVRQSGGYVWAESEPGKGSEFKVLLPRQREDATAPLPSTSSPAVRGTERVLLVEDEAPVRSAARRMLQELGYTVYEARNGQEALAWATRHPGDIDLVVTDTVMPEMSGRELVEALRRQHSAVRVLYMSGYTEDEIVRRGMAPDTAFLSKPFTPAALGAAVRAALDGTPPVA